jgi:ribose-phosphate pyrophosphokinase
MMQTVVFDIFGQVALTKKIKQKLNCEMGEINFHHFPDGEVLAKIATPIKNKQVIFVADLNRPNTHIIELLFAASTATELGAKSIQLVAPYLPYMRQDSQFNPGEGISAKYFAKLLSPYFDRIITIDPHLHRFTSLSEIYTTETAVLHATNIIGKWVHEHIKDPIIIGPDSESKQWAHDIAATASVPYVVAHKERKGDFDVNVVFSDLDLINGKTPVIVDDIISTASTMEKAVLALQKNHITTKPICIGVHAVFANETYNRLLENGAASYMTCNTIPHPSNAIDISELIINTL